MLRERRVPKAECRGAPSREEAVQTQGSMGGGGGGPLRGRGDSGVTKICQLRCGTGRTAVGMVKTTEWHVLGG